MAEMTDILRRLKALTGPDPEVEELIALDNGWKQGSIYGVEGYWFNPQGHVADPPRYTKSLDAVLMLIPKGCEDWTVALDTKRGLGHYASVGAEDMGAAYLGPTPAIALLIAIYEMREAALPSHEPEGE